MHSNKSCAIIIPARYASSRLPGKPLLDLNGVPMIVRTYNQCAKSTLCDSIHVATDDTRIIDTLVEHEIPYIETPSTCLTGTDRVAYAARSIKSDIIINVQGDEPVIPPADIDLLIQQAATSSFPICNGFTQCSSASQVLSLSTPKVVIRNDGRLLYMSRSAIPGTKDNLDPLSFSSFYRQVCVYSYTHDALDAFSSAPSKTPLESVEDIEIIRFLELGFDVFMVELSNLSIPVDTVDDVAKVLSVLNTK